MQKGNIVDIDAAKILYNLNLFRVSFSGKSRTVGLFKYQVEVVNFLDLVQFKYRNGK